jgi:hypothetical protein
MPKKPQKIDFVLYVGSAIILKLKSLTPMPALSH